MVPSILLEATLEAEEEDCPGGDVEEEGEADPEGGEEHWADRVAAPETEGYNLSLWCFVVKMLYLILVKIQILTQYSTCWFNKSKFHW